jgi:hypothetical protein
MTTTKKDFWKDGYDKPCKANNFQSNYPGAFAIDLHYTTDHCLQDWLTNTKRSIETCPQWNKFEQRRLASQLRTINEEIEWRKANN